MHLPTTRRQLRRALAGALGSETGRFAGLLAGAAAPPLVLGDPGHETWHFVAHLGQEAQAAGARHLVPTWVRWSAPPGAPPHLACTVADLTDLGRRRPLLVLGAEADPLLLERVADVLRRGGRVLGVDGGHGEVAALAHEQLVAAPGELDRTEHLLSLLAPRAATAR